MDKLTLWFYSLQSRERMIVVAAGVLLLLVAVYALALAPFYATVNARAERVAAKEGDLAWMRSVAGDVMALSEDAPAAILPSDESLVVMIDRAARECGLSSALTGQTPNGPTAIRVRLEEAEFDKLVLCLARLQQSQAVSIESATIDRTSKPGFVNASLVLNRAPG
jgi:type II secretory pathway component PulM